MAESLLVVFLKALVLCVALLGGFAYMTLIERRILGRMQHRIGPNRTGPFGLMQLIADALKAIFKQDIMPARSDKFVFVVPEYNGSFPGILKGFIDGMTYPNSFNNKKCALVGLSSGVGGGGIAMSHLTDIFHYLGMHVLANKPKLAKIEENMSDNLLTNKFYLELLYIQAQMLIDF